MNSLKAGMREFRMKPKDMKYAAAMNRSSERKMHSSSQTAVKSFEEIPGPKPIPVFGNLWRYSSFIGEYSFEKIHSTYHKMYQQYGALVKENLFWDRIIIHAFDPEDMLRVYMNEGRKPFRKSHRALEKYRKDRPCTYNSAGLFPSNGEEWYRFRRLFQTILLSPQKANSYLNKLEDVTEDMVKRVAHLLDECGEVDMQPILFNWALECIGMITLNRRLGCLSNNGNKEAYKLVKAAHDIHQAVFVTEINPLWNFFPTPSYSRLVSAQDFLASVVKKHLEEAISDLGKEETDDTLLSSMMNVPSADEKDVFTMILDMFLAGIDTTAYTTAFGLYNLAVNQEVQDKLHKELSTHLPHRNSRISEKKRELTYLQNVIKESLRINPVSVGTGRVLPTDLVLSGYNVPKGTMVILQHQVASKLNKNFTQPEKFFPDRWDKSHPYYKEINRNVSSPFGFGPRLCVGRRFAEREMILALGKVIRNYKISYHYDPIDSRNRLINVPDKPVKLRFKLREK